MPKPILLSRFYNAAARAGRYFAHYTRTFLRAIPPPSSSHSAKAMRTTIRLVGYLIPLALALYFYLDNRSLNRRAALNDIVAQSPVLSYSWLSNYNYLAYHPRGAPAEQQVARLVSRFEIRNASGSDLENARIHFQFSVDSLLYCSPYGERKGLELLQKHLPIWRKDSSISFDVCEGLRAKRLDLRMLFPGEQDAYHTACLSLARRSRPLGAPFAFEESKDGTVPYVPLTIRGIYFRCVITFFLHGISYCHVLSGALAFGFPDPADNTMTKAMYVIDGLFKHEWTQVKLPAGVECVRIPQYVYRGSELYEDLRALDDFASGDDDVALSLSDLAGNNAEIRLWQREANDRYYYDKYAHEYLPAPIELTR